MNPIFFLIIFFIPISFAFGAEVTYSFNVPIWYSYDCTDATPNTWTKANPDISKFKYFDYYFDGTCYATMLNYDLSDLTSIENTTAVNVTEHTRGVLITDPDLSQSYNDPIPCSLFYFDNPGFNEDVISKEPTVIGSFSCTDGGILVQEIQIPFSAGQITTFQNNLQGGNETIALMVFPTYNATMRSSLDSNNYEYGIERHESDLTIEGDGFSCVIIQASGYCNILNDWWGAVSLALGKDWIGDWFYVIVFFPFPMATFLITRNGTYAGFIGLGIMLTIQTIDRTIFEIALSMILISAGFGFYEIVRKKLVE